MESLSGWFEKLVFGIKAGPTVITVIGSGGKTSLIRLLAAHFSRSLVKERRKVLVTTTTKMFPLPPLDGVTTVGCFNEKTGKLESLPLYELERIIPDFDLVLIEGDGSRELPLKGWADSEPVVPPFTTITVGVLPLWPLGMTVSEKIVHRLPLFCDLSGASPGEVLSVSHLAAVISGTKANTTAGEISAAKSLSARPGGSRFFFLIR
ncbi:hypothetical protein AGMMS50293_29110 [Spirochaetia bacterium]|nr:hypothetical protein AGMMS50293_29110 [Spirochaetia bacterium]